MTMIVERTDVTTVMVESCGMRPDSRVTWVEPFRWRGRKGWWMYEVTAVPGSGDVIRPTVPIWEAKFAEQFRKHMAKMDAKAKAAAKRAAKKAAAPSPRMRAAA
jgi:hypothetical protein